MIRDCSINPLAHQMASCVSVVPSWRNIIFLANEQEASATKKEGLDAFEYLHAGSSEHYEVYGF